MIIPIADAKNIAGRGTVLICRYVKTLHAGDTIEIEGELFKVAGIETLCPAPIFMGVVIPRQDDPKRFIRKELRYDFED